MTKQILIDEATVKLALKELETWKRFTHGENEHTNKAIKVLEEALAKQEHVGEPVAWEGFTNFANPLGTRLIFTTKFEADEWLKDFVEGHAWLKPLSYTTPQPKQEQSVSVSTKCVGEPVAATDIQISYEAHAEDPLDWNDLNFKECWHKGFADGFKAAETFHKIGVSQ